LILVYGSTIQDSKNPIIVDMKGGAWREKFLADMDVLKTKESDFTK